MNLEDIILSEISQKENSKNHMVSFMWNIKQKSNKEFKNKQKKLIDTTTEWWLPELGMRGVQQIA